MNPVDRQKEAAGEAAALEIQNGMTVGLGTGSTAAYFVKALARRAAAERLDLRCVPTSRATAELAQGLGLVIASLDEVDGIDITVDGADEVGPDLALIKGGGAALLREKLVWEASTRCIVIADAAKVVPSLGAFPLPIEVVGFGHGTTARRIAGVAEELGLVAVPTLRTRDGTPVQTDSGQVIYDLPCGVIVDPSELATALKQITGVIDHGLFIGLASEALIGTDDGVARLARQVR
jgi:ribose 5-phosphate isomerase A